MDEYIVVLITAPTEAEASKIGRDLVEARLAACVNIVRNIRSIYRWKGNIEEGDEALMIAKTRRSHLEDLIGRVREAHSYSLPEIIALPIPAGSEEYLSWLRDETEKG